MTMKKIYLLIAALMVAATSFSQTVIFSSSFENWTNGLPDGWMGSKSSIESDSVVQVTTGTMYGSNAVELINTESTHKRFTTQNLTVTGGQDYEIKFWVKGKGDIRTALFDTTYGAYNSYINVDATDWTEYSQIVTALGNSDSAQFIISVRYTDSVSGHLQLDSVVISEATVTVDTVSIHDIQYTTDASGDSPYKDQIVYTGGIVTAKGNGSYFIQAGSGPWNGVYVYDNLNNPAVGDSVIVKATVTEYYNLTELKNITSFVVVSSANTLPAPVELATGDVADEQYEGVLVKVMNAECTTDTNNYGEWIVNDGTGDLLVKNMYSHFAPTVGEHYNITAPVYFSYNNFKLVPNSENDVEIVNNVETSLVENNAVKLYPVPASTFINVEANNYIKDVKIYTLEGQLVAKYNVNAKNGTLYGLTSGNYIFRINTEKGTVERKVTVR
jgi:hypothetical protein